MADSRSSKKRTTNKKVIEKINLFLKKQKDGSTDYKRR
jgi:hypothetical protein